MALLVNRSTARRRDAVANVRERLGVPGLPAQRRGGGLPPDRREPPPDTDGRVRCERPRPGARPRVAALVATDAAAAAIAAALWVVLWLDVAGRWTAVPAGLAGLAWLGCLAFARSYAPRLRRTGRDVAREVLAAALVLLCVAGLAGLLLGVTLPRSGVVTLVAAMAGMTLVTRGLTGRTTVRARSARRTRVAVVGEREDVVRRFVEDLRGSGAGAYDVTAVCLLGSGSTSWEGPVLRDLEALAETAARQNLDAVVVLPSHALGPEQIRALAWRLEKHGTHLFVVPGLPEVSVRRVALTVVGGTVAVHVHHAELEGVRRLAKEAFDRVAAFAALAVVLPLLAVLMLAVRLDSPGPSLFRQERVGKDGRRFTMLKLRTMSVDAETRRAELLERNESDGGVLFKIRHDPRVTRVGALLRRYSLDELPQLVNVLCGDMSLVGPRPPLPAEVAAYEDPVHRRLAVKPGITGLWQVSGRSDLSWAESVRLDLRYVENWSLGMDAAILWRTGRAVIDQDGAY